MTKETEMRISKNIIKRRPLHYEHTTTVIYPKENVNNMLASWSDSKQTSLDFIKDSKKLQEDAFNNGCEKIDKTYTDMVSSFAKTDMLTVAERAAKFEKEYQSYKKAALEDEGAVQRQKDELAKELDKQTLMHLKKHRKNAEDMTNALKLWSVPITEKEE